MQAVLTKLWSRNEEGGIQRHKTIIEEGDQSFLEAWKVVLGPLWTLLGLPPFPVRLYLSPQ